MVFGVCNIYYRFVKRGNVRFKVKVLLLNNMCINNKGININVFHCTVVLGKRVDGCNRNV